MQTKTLNRTVTNMILYIAMLANNLDEPKPQSKPHTVYTEHSSARGSNLHVVWPVFSLSVEQRHERKGGCISLCGSYIPSDMGLGLVRGPILLEI